MTVLTDFSTPGAKVRLLIGDIEDGDFIFNDPAIDAFLSMNDDNIKLAASQALFVIAINEVLVQKRIRLLDLNTDGPAEAESLRELAMQYRKEGNETAMGGIGYLDVPSGIERFDERVDNSWTKLLEVDDELGYD